MARKKVIDLDASKTVGFGKEQGQIGVGGEIAGYYLGCRNVKTSMGPSVLHVLQTSEGNLGVWGSAQLNAKLGSIALGTMVFITYRGKVKVPKGTMKKFDVEYDDEETIHVDTPQVNFRENSEPEESEEEGAEEAEESEEEESEEQDAEESEEEETEEAPPKKTMAPAKKPAGNAPSAEAKARAAALLGKKKTS